MATNAAPPTSSASPKPRSRARKPKPWLERGLLYSTLIGSLLTAGPLWIDQAKAAWQGISGGSVEEAELQNALWRKNMDCAASPYAWFNNPSNIKVDATICDSGDIFVRASTPSNGQFFKWIPLSDVIEADDEGGGIFPPAHAAALPAPVSAATVNPGQWMHRLAQPGGQANVVCQRFLDNRRLLRRVQTPQGCFDEVIDTFNGAVVSRRPVPCTPQC